MIWSPSLIAELKRLWTTTASASQIARVLSEFSGSPVTKNMVIGKRNRLGLPKRREGSPGRRGDRRPHEYRPPGLEPSKPRTMAPIAPLPSIPVEVPVSALIQLFPDPPPVTEGILLRDADASFLQCRWIDGEPNGPDTLFCGHTVVWKATRWGQIRQSYCAEHLSRVEGKPSQSLKKEAA